MTEKYGEDHSAHPTFDDTVYKDVVGPSTKGRVRGLGKAISIGSSTSASGNSTGCSAYLGDGQFTMEDIDARIQQTVHQSVQRSVEESLGEVRQTMKSFQDMMTMFMNQMSGQQVGHQTPQQFGIQMPQQVGSQTPHQFRPQMPQQYGTQMPQQFGSQLPMFTPQNPGDGDGGLDDIARDDEN
jgi:hypothetical protein